MTAADRLNPLLSARVAETFRAGNDLADLALYGGPLHHPTPTTPGGLAMTGDGPAWTIA